MSILSPITCLLAIILLNLSVFPISTVAAEPREIIVGVWDNPPIVFRDASGEIQGIGIDILKQVASKKGWNPIYIHGSWPEEYEGLKNHEIDLLVGIAYTAERDKLFDYPEQTVINNWGVIYQTPDNDLTSIEDLKGKRIALVKEIIHSKVFTELMNQFGFPFEVVPAKDFKEVLTILDKGNADAGIINRVFSIMHADKYHVKPTTIIFNPVQVRMAVPEGTNHDLIQAIDEYLVEAKSDSNSLYYQSVNKWLKTEAPKPNYGWILAVLSLLLIIALLVASYIYLVRREVKRRTAALAESETRFRQMADNINAVFWIVSADWNEVVYVSPAYRKIWDRDVDSLYNNPRSWLEFVHPDDLTQVEEDIASKTPPNRSVPAFREYRIIRPDRRECWISTHAYPVYDKTGHIYRYAGISEDVTARKLAELALARSKLQIETVLNAIRDVIVYGDLNRRIVLTNPAVEKVFGYSSEELVGKKTEILYANKADFAYQGKRQFDKTSSINSAIYELEYRRKDGSTFVGETFGAKVFDNEGEPIGFIGVIRDVTERKQVELELLDHRDHLEELVTERTAELSNLIRELEAFSYSVSHDLRAPLRAINGFSSLLCEENKDQLNEDGKNYLQRIANASIKMERLIDDLLQMSRVSRVDLHKEEIDLSLMAEEILATLHNDSPDRQVTWEIEKEIIVKGDKTLLHVMMQNLIGNAWKYTEKKPNTVIRFFRQSINGSNDVFCVEDNGIGFDMQYKEKIFQPFQRLHTDQEFEGTGIGLATVSRVIHRHAGTIWVESGKESGSRFYFRL